MKDLNKLTLHKPTFFYTHWRRMLLHIYTMNQLRTRRYRWLNPYKIEKSRPKMKDLRYTELQKEPFPCCQCNQKTATYSNPVCASCRDLNKITNKNHSIFSRVHQRRIEIINHTVYKMYRDFYNVLAKWSNPNK